MIPCPVAMFGYVVLAHTYQIFVSTVWLFVINQKETIDRASAANHVRMHSTKLG